MRERLKSEINPRSIVPFFCWSWHDVVGHIRQLQSNVKQNYLLMKRVDNRTYLEFWIFLTWLWGFSSRRVFFIWVRKSHWTRFPLNYINENFMYLLSFFCRMSLASLWSSKTFILLLGKIRRFVFDLSIAVVSCVFLYLFSSLLSAWKWEGCLKSIARSLASFASLFGASVCWFYDDDHVVSSWL